MIPGPELLEGLVRALLAAGLKGSLLIVAVLALRGLLGSRIPPRLLYGLWLLVAVRLLIPWAPASDWSVFALPGLREAVELVQTPSYAGAAVQAVGSDDAALLDGAGLGAAFVDLMVWLWPLGLVLLLWRLVLRARALNESNVTVVRDASTLRLYDRCLAEMGLKKRVPLLRSADCPTPAMTGILRPRILMPAPELVPLDERGLRFVLLHELAHLRRRDVAAGLLAELVLALHWFNPLVWIALGRMAADRELACDQKVLERLDEGEHRAYGHSILDVIEHSAGWVTAPLAVAFGGDAAELKRRLGAIRRGARRSVLSRAATWVGIALLVPVFLTDSRLVVNPLTVLVDEVRAEHTQQRARGVGAGQAGAEHRQAAARERVWSDGARAEAGGSVRLEHSPAASLNFVSGLSPGFSMSAGAASYDGQAVWGAALAMVGPDGQGQAARQTPAAARIVGGVGGHSEVTDSAAVTTRRPDDPNDMQPAPSGGTTLAPRPAGARGGWTETDSSTDARPVSSADARASGVLPGTAPEEHESVGPAVGGGSGLGQRFVYVDAASPDCVDYQRGTMVAPNCDLQTAVDFSMTGDVLRIAPGDYDQVYVGVDLVLLGGWGLAGRAGGGPLGTRLRSIVSGRHALTVGPGVTLIVEGFEEIAGHAAGLSDDDQGGVLLRPGASVRLSRSVVHGGVATGSGQSAAVASFGAVVLVEDCALFGGASERQAMALQVGSGKAVVRRSELDGGLASHGDTMAVVTEAGTSLTAFNSVFDGGLSKSGDSFGARLAGDSHGLANNVLAGGLSEAGRSHALLVLGSGKFVVVNNVLLPGARGEFAYGFRVELSGAGEMTLLNNNLRGRSRAGSGAYLSIGQLNSCFWWGCGAANFSDPPDFVDSKHGDYRLNGGSPNIDTGVDPSTQGLELRVDMNRNPRPLDGDDDGVSSWDVGPAEY